MGHLPWSLLFCLWASLMDSVKLQTQVFFTKQIKWEGETKDGHWNTKSFIQRKAMFTLGIKMWPISECCLHMHFKKTCS